ncbi:hypothetical protein [Sinorhizobium medicae]|uniref:hypothetical protein n=1 Tax=Sinorhizobium medicae TaxID=110321 RepID=UPI000FDAF042|nr:hypothetical protein [Sinorhizobium medicae]RVP47337.1 hypothetical protein CN078_26850 [Sinorhizobium medicae]RVP75440.1 hypothetical protein CN079_20105 [Sinorhizobium medicae]UWU06584.1 hypothetical protein N2598_09315 [Sinorhizobium medicae]
MRRFRPPPKPVPDARGQKVKEALIVLATVAAEDADYAKAQNGVGFSRPDSAKGHSLAQLSVRSVLQDESCCAEVLKMAARYRRQASRIAQGDLL